MELGGPTQCGQCDNLAANACPRCGAPVCEAHALSPDDRCPACERSYKVHRRLRMWVLFCLILVLPLAVSALVDTAMGWGLLVSYGKAWQWAAEAAMQGGYAVSFLCGLIVCSPLAILAWAVVSLNIAEKIEAIQRRAFLAEADPNPTSHN